MKDNRIEDFFNKSLESFNDAPTDAVWAGLADRLDEEKATPFYKKSLFIIGMLSLLLLTFSGFSLVIEKNTHLSLSKKP